MAMNLSTMNAPASDRQLNKLSRLTKLDTSSISINVGKANNLIQDSLYGLDITNDLISLGARRKPEFKKLDINNVWDDSADVEALLKEFE